MSASKIHHSYRVVFPLHVIIPSFISVLVPPSCACLFLAFIHVLPLYLTLAPSSLEQTQQRYLITIPITIGMHNHAHILL